MCLNSWLLWRHICVSIHFYPSLIVHWTLAGWVPRTKGRSRKAHSHPGVHNSGELASEEQPRLRNHAWQWLQVGHAALQTAWRGTWSKFLNLTDVCCNLIDCLGICRYVEIIQVFWAFPFYYIPLIFVVKVGFQADKPGGNPMKHILLIFMMVFYELLVN